MSIMRNLFGTRHRHHLALEDISANAPVVDETPTAATEDTTVVMKGPLADVYSAALSKVLDKSIPEAPAEGDPTVKPLDPAEAGATVDTSNLKPAEGQTQETVETAIISEVGNLVLESQAIDAAVVSSVASLIADEAPEDSTNYETLYAIDETQVTPDNVQDVTELLAQADRPENITVLIDDVVPDDVLDATSPTVMEKTNDLAMALESLVSAMGGKVVHSFGDYIKSRAERQAK